MIHIKKISDKHDIFIDSKVDKTYLMEAGRIILTFDLTGYGKTSKGRVLGRAIVVDDCWTIKNSLGIDCISVPLKAKDSVFMAKSDFCAKLLKKYPTLVNV